MRVAFLAAILALVAVPASASPVVEATGAGTFRVATDSATLLVAGRGELTVTNLDLVLIDDYRYNQVPNPVDPNNDLASSVDRNTTHVTAPSARITWLPHDDAVIISRGNTNSSFWGIRVVATDTTLLDRSHFFGKNHVAPAGYDYEVKSPAGVLATSPDSNQTLYGPGSLYAWEADVVIQTPKGSTTYTTGHYATSTVAQTTDHYVFANLSYTNATGHLEGPATVYAPAAYLSSDEPLILRGPEPSTSLRRDVDARHGISLSSPGGQLTAILPESTAVAPALGGSAANWWWALVGPLLLAACTAPTIQGYLVQRRRGELRGSQRRAEGYAAWAAVADGRGHRRLAAWLSGRAVRNARRVPDFLVEHAILLRQAGSPAKALLAHDAAEDLLPDSPGCGYEGLNAYHAALAAMDAAPEAALAWLQLAVDREPGLAAEAAGERRFRTLRSNPDFEAVLGTIGIVAAK